MLDMHYEVILLPDDFSLQEMPYRDIRGEEQVCKVSSGNRLVFIELSMNGKVFFRGPCEQSNDFCDWIKDGNDPYEFPIEKLETTCISFGNLPIYTKPPWYKRFISCLLS